jgi:hypothetical protein
MMRKLVSILMIIGGIGALWLGCNELKHGKATKEWPIVEGEIISSKVVEEVHRSPGSIDKSITYTPKVQFKYSVEGVNYVSNNIFAGRGEYKSPRRSSAQNIVKKYPEGKKVLVYYNPDNPSEAVLEPGTPPGIYLPFLVGIVFLFIGIVFVVREIVSFLRGGIVYL